MDGVNLAISILTRAVTLDEGKRFTESLVCYQEGIHILLETIKTFSNDDQRKERLRKKCMDYMTRAEKLKQHIEDLKSKGNYREQIQIEEDATGFSYQSVFSRFFEDTVTTVEIQDPYIRSVHQCDNLVRFLELCVSKCSQLKKVKLVTGKDGNNIGDQAKRLDSIRKSLQKIPGKSNPIQLEIQFSDVLHDREIRLDNGWVLKVGRGLDYFKPQDRFTIGFTDFNFRACRATTIDIFHKKELQRVQ